MPNSDDNLKAYFNKIIEIQQSQKNAQLSEGDLKSIAKNLGFSEDDWQFIEQNFQDHLKRAGGFLGHQNWTDAIDEFNQALILKPHHVKTLYGIASAYKGRWEENHNKDDKAKALTFAQQCLKVKADHAGALKLISDLRKGQNQQVFSYNNSVQKGQQKRIATGIMIGLGIIVFLASLFIFMGVENQKVDDDFRPEFTQESQNETQNSTSSTYSNPNTNALPITFKDNAQTKGLKFVQQQSKFYTTNKYYSYSINGHLLVEDNIVVNNLSIKVDFLNEKGEVIFSDLKSIVRKNAVSYYKGDFIPLKYYKYQSDVTAMPNWKSVQLSVDFIEKYTANKINFPKKDFDWLSPQKPAGVDLELRERESKFSFYSNSSSFHKIQLEFLNTGTKPLKNLRAKIEWLDPNGKVFQMNDKLYINTTSKPLIEKGQNRIFQGTYSLEGRQKNQIGGYRIIVINAD